MEVALHGRVLLGPAVVVDEEARVGLRGGAETVDCCCDIDAGGFGVLPALDAGHFEDKLQVGLVADGLWEVVGSQAGDGLESLRHLFYQAGCCACRFVQQFVGQNRSLKTSAARAADSMEEHRFLQRVNGFQIAFVAWKDVSLQY